MARRTANVNNTSTFSPKSSATSTPTMTGGSQTIGTDVGYTGSFTPQMSAPINFSVQGGGTVGAGKTVRGSRLGRGGPELTRPVSGNVTMGNVSISSTMSPTFSNIGNVDASVKGVSGGTQAQVAPISTNVGEVPRMAGALSSTQTVGTGRGSGGESVGPRPKGFDLSSYDVTSQGGAGFGLKDIEYLRSQGVTDTQLKDFAGGLGANVNVGKVAKETLGLGITVPAPPGVKSTPEQRKDTAQLESQMGRPTTPANAVPTGPYAPGKGATPETTAALGQLTGQMSSTGGLQTPTGTKASTNKTTTTKKETPAKAEQAKPKSQVVKAKKTVKTAKETPKEDRTKADQKALEAAKAKLQLERLQAEKEKAERTKKEQRAVAEAKAKAQAAAEAAAKAKAKAQAAKKAEPAKTTKKK